MSDDLEVRGGAGGLGATYDDMLTFAGLVDAAGDQVGSTTSHLAGLGTSLAGDLTEAALLVPDKVAEAETKHAVGLASSGLLLTELEVTARLVRASVWAYRTTDAALAALQEQAFTTGGFLLGTQLLPLAGVSLLLAASHDPQLAAMLATPEGRAALQADLQRTLYENPWLVDALTRSAPGLVQGTSLGILGPFGTTLLSGGQWPTGDYHDALTGLLTAGGLFGRLGDRGTFGITGRRPTRLDPASFAPGSFVWSVMDQQELLGRASAEQAQVQVVRVTRPDGSSAWIVQIPGTQEMATLAHVDNPLDMDTNLNLMQREGMGPPTAMEQQVLAAMHRAGIGPNDPVMLTGHSQGGITAASLATRRPAGFHITSVVTAGSPIARFDIPDDVSVLSLEHAQDVIPHVDAADNPDRAGWTTVTRDLDASDAPETAAGAHSLRAYKDTAGLVDHDGTDASLAAWREQNQAFFTGAGTTVEGEQFTIGRTGP
jgi:hypothetical protein